MATQVINMDQEHRQSEMYQPKRRALSEDEEVSYDQEEQDGDDDFDKYSYDNLQKLHQKQMDEGVSFIASTSELVDMLGGIDLILSNYLNSDNRMLLNEIQRTRIYQVLSKPPLQGHKNEAPKDYTYLFSIQSTSMHLCLSKENAQKFTNFIFHYLTVIFLTVLGLVLLIFQIGIKNISQRTWFTYYQSLFYVVAILWLLVVILLTNKSALCVVAKTFEFVLKLLLTVFAILMEYLWYFVVNKVNASQRTLLQELLIYVSWLALLLLIIVVSSLDALYVKIWVKVWLGVVVAIALIIHTWRISQDDTDDAFEVVGTSISLGSLAASSLQFVLLFVLKHTILSLLKREKIISVKSSPYVKWVNDTGVHKQSSVFSEN